jgi:hypothetical protein
MDLWTAPAALGNDDRSARVGICQRETTYRATGACSVAPSARPRLGALLSSDDFGSSVERTAKLHPLWRWEVRLVCAAWWGALDGVQLWFQLVVRLSVL